MKELGPSPLRMHRIGHTRLIRLPCEDERKLVKVVVGYEAEWGEGFNVRFAPADYDIEGLRNPSFSRLRRSTSATGSPTRWVTSEVEGCKGLPRLRFRIS